MIRFPPKKVLVPIDLSEISWTTLRYARAFSERFGATVEAVYVAGALPSVSGGFYTPPLDKRVRSSVTSYVRSRLGFDCPVRIVRGDPMEEVLGVIDARRPDLVVLGGHRYSAWERFLTGSVGETVVRNAPVPILTLAARPRPIRSILAPVNFTEYGQGGLLFAAEVASAFDARVCAFHVVCSPQECPNPRFAVNNMIAHLPKDLATRCRPGAAIHEGRVADALLKEARRHDLVVMTSHRKSRVGDFLNGTTAEQVLRECDVPVLTIPVGLTEVEKAARASGKRSVAATQGLA
ncbi:MAG: universal stress protein [Elusimicrobia bacterium]|nr:universal stress protein [Elusimicrobiota bacterium]